jgi:hypothetical protein
LGAASTLFISIICAVGVVVWRQVRDQDQEGDVWVESERRMAGNAVLVDGRNWDDRVN